MESPHIEDIGLVLDLRDLYLRLCGIKGELSAFSLVRELFADALCEALLVEG